MVLHPGSHVGIGVDAGIYNIANALNKVLSGRDEHVTILLETMAGKGTEIGSKLEEIEKIISLVEEQDRIGVCLDTCHLHDAGYDMNHFDEFLDNLSKYADEYTKEYLLSSNINGFDETRTLENLRDCGIEWKKIDLEYIKNIINIIHHFDD